MKKLFVISTLIVVLPALLAAQTGGAVSTVGEASAVAAGTMIGRASTAPAAGVGAAATPPMGWNSYNCFGSAVHEDEVRANADYMAQHLKRFGWQYIVVDFLWSYDNPPGSLIGNVSQMRLEDGSYVPWLAMDKWIISPHGAVLVKIKINKSSK